MSEDRFPNLASEVGAALAEGLAAADKAKEKEAEAKRMAEKQSCALHQVLDSFEAARLTSRTAVEHAVFQYCHAAETSVLKALGEDPRMPRTINYLKRYEALLGMEDREVVLQRLESTLDLADDIINTAESIDIQVAVDEAAAKYARLVMLLDGIIVSEPDESYVEPSCSDPTKSTASSARSAIETAFSSSIGELTEIERSSTDRVESAKAYERLVDERIAKSAEAAVKVTTVTRRQEAEAVAGQQLSLCKPDKFEGEITAQVSNGLEKVRKLSAEVRKSFLTFKQVVQDNGLFAAFSSETSYGACSGVSFNYWWDDDSPYFEYWGDSHKKARRKAIPTSIEEDQGGDSLDKAIERMSHFNKQRYWGMLDDDFQQHVEAFWYGFSQLMENTNCLFAVDMRGFGAYCQGLTKMAADRAGCLGEGMDNAQVHKFCDEVDRRTAGLQEA